MHSQHMTLHDKFKQLNMNLDFFSKKTLHTSRGCVLKRVRT